MRRCVVCGDPYYSASEIDPAEPCWCGDMAWGDLWGWDRWRAYRREEHQERVEARWRARGLVAAE